MVHGRRENQVLADFQGLIQRKNIVRSEVFDCTSCGVCCVSLYGNEVFCDITEEDYNNLPKSFRRHCGFFSTLQLLSGLFPPGVIGALKTRWRKQRSGPAKDFEICTCEALRGSLLRKVRCAIYDCRPQCCHTAVKPGDTSCRSMRELFDTNLRDLKDRQDAE